MSEGHSSPIDAPATIFDNAAAPVPVDVRGQASQHAQTTDHAFKEKGSGERLTPRPTFMKHLANSRDSQFHLHRRDSSELERYFVCVDPGSLRTGYRHRAELTSTLKARTARHG